MGYINTNCLLRSPAAVLGHCWIRLGFTINENSSSPAKRIWFVKDWMQTGFFQSLWKQRSEFGTWIRNQKIMFGSSAQPGFKQQCNLVMSEVYRIYVGVLEKQFLCVLDTGARSHLSRLHQSLACICKSSPVRRRAWKPTWTATPRYMVGVCGTIHWE